MAKIKVLAKYNLPLIAARAGNGDVNGRLYSDGVLYVENVTQAALEKAVAEYDDPVDGWDAINAGISNGAP